MFNKKIGAKSGSNALADVTAALTVLSDGAVFNPSGVVATEGDNTGKSFDVNFTSASLYGTAGTNKDLILSFAKDAVVDVFGNTNPASSHAVKMTKDTVAPTLAGSSVSTDKKTITLTFSEEVTVDDAKFVVRRDGIAVDVSTLTIASHGEDKKKVVITKDDASAFVAGTYSLRLEAGAVTDLVELNSSALTTTSVVVPTGSVEATKLVSAVANGSSNNVFEVTFTDNGSAKAVSADTALNLANYKLDGKALPAGTDIYFKNTDKNVVVIELPENSINIGKVGTGTNAILSVSNVKSVSDNKTVVANSGTVVVEDNTGAVLTAAKVIGNNVVVTFNEALDAATAEDLDIAAVLANYEIYAGTTKVVAGATGGAATADLVAGKDNEVIITFTNTTGTNFDAAKTITVKTLAGDLTDANLYDVKAGVQVTATK